MSRPALTKLAEKSSATFGEGYMSRIGKKPVAVPAGVKVAVAGNMITIEGKLGKLTYAFDKNFKVEAKDIVDDWDVDFFK